MPETHASCSRQAFKAGVHFRDEDEIQEDGRVWSAAPLGGQSDRQTRGGAPGAEPETSLNRTWGSNVNFECVRCVRGRPVQVRGVSRGAIAPQYQGRGGTEPLGPAGAHVFHAAACCRRGPLPAAAGGRGRGRWAGAVTLTCQRHHDKVRTEEGTTRQQDWRPLAGSLPQAPAGRTERLCCIHRVQEGRGKGGAHAEEGGAAGRTSCGVRCGKLFFHRGVYAAHVCVCALGAR